MNEDRREELVLAWIDGELDEAGRGELTAALADPVELAEFAALVRAHQLLRVAARSDAAGTATAVLRIRAALTEREAGRPGSARMAAIRGRLRRRRSMGWSLGWPVGLAAAAGLMALIAVALWSTTRPVPGPAWQDQAWTATAEALTVLLADGSRITLAPGSRVETSGSGHRLRLERGELSAEVVPHPRDDPFQVTASRSRVTVLGTGFTVSADPGYDRIRVSHGLVQVERLGDGGRVEIGAGQTTTVMPDGGFAARPLPPPAGLLAAWDCEGEGRLLRDLTGHGHDATLQHGRLVAGRSGQALSMDWDCSDPRIPATVAALPLTTIGVSLWLQPSRAFAGQRWPILIGSEDAVANAGWILTGGDDGRIHWRINTATGTSYATAAMPSLHTWIHLAASWDGRSAKLWVGGRLAAEVGGPASGDLRASGRAIQIGPVPGLLDEIRLYDRPLDNDDIRQLAR
jgi:ferric-dicitrate binding protein FerR (iron transport regulator)